MFAHQKKDYYSVNADISIEANQQQRQFENAQMTSMLQNEGFNFAAGTNYESVSNQFGNYPPGSENDEQFEMEQNEMYEQQQMQLAMLEE